MAKRKFIEKRRKERIVERDATIDPRDYRTKLISLLENLNVDFETHGGENEKDDYYGFTLSYDPPCDRMWYIVKNPFGGNDLELAIESEFDLAFGAGCANRPPCTGSTVAPTVTARWKAKQHGRGFGIIDAWSKHL